MSDTNIHTGVYEQIINRLFKLKLNEVDAGRFYIGKKLISKDDAVHILSKYLQHLIEVAFAGTPDDQDADKYTDFVNSVIKTLGREFNVDDTELDLIDAQKSILTAVVDRTNCEYPDIEQHLKAITPTTSLSRSALFFGGKGPADMESELNREILCADEICWVVSFIKTSGLNLLWNSLQKFTSEGKKLRIITTTYTGATDYDAMVRLASLPNTEILPPSTSNTSVRPIPTAVFSSSPIARKSFVRLCSPSASCSKTPTSAACGTATTNPPAISTSLPARTRCATAWTICSSPRISTTIWWSMRSITSWLPPTSS